MPIDLAALKAEIQSGPLAAELAPLIAAGRFHAAADVLNRKDYRGPVPLEELSSYCVTRGVTGAVQTLDEIPLGGTIAEGGTMTAQIKGLLKTVLTIVQTDWRLSVADMDDPAAAGLFAGLAALGVITPQQQVEIDALANGRRGRAEIVVGRPVTYSDVTDALEVP